MTLSNRRDSVTVRPIDAVQSKYTMSDGARPIDGFMCPIGAIQSSIVEYSWRRTRERSSGKPMRPSLVPPNTHGGERVSALSSSGGVAIDGEDALDRAAGLAHLPISW